VAQYVKSTNFATKDALLSGNPAKIIKGTEIDDEYNAIAVAVSTKADLVSPTFTGTPTAPTAAGGTSTTQIATTAFATTAAAAVFPIGGIILWSGAIANIPTNWALCNGSNSTPDLRDRFVVGAGSTYSVADTGGSADAVVVSHTHTGTTASSGNHRHFVVTANSTPGNSTAPTSTTQVDYGAPNRNNAGAEYVLSGSSTDATIGRSSENGDHTHTITTDSTGVSATNANLPPYYALAYIMKIA
jgi:hypothetical protein